MKVGAPTKYKEEYAQTIIDLALKDLPISDWYKELGSVVPSTFTYWKSKHPEFSKAYDNAVEILKSNTQKYALMCAKGAIDMSSTQLGALKYYAATALRMRENDSKEEIEDAVNKALPKFVNED